MFLSIVFMIEPHVKGFFFLYNQDGKIAGRGILIAGQPGTGKTAIAMGKLSEVLTKPL